MNNTTLSKTTALCVFQIAQMKADTFAGTIVLILPGKFQIHHPISSKPSGLLDKQKVHLITPHRFLAIAHLKKGDLKSHDIHRNYI
jgi:hypothetical protein